MANYIKNGKFRTHIGEIVEGEQLQSALNAVADWRAETARVIHTSGAYASHVTQSQKDSNLARALEDSEKIRAGEITNFTIWQRVNSELTGECIAFLQGV